jgi:CRP-like cAMP-binding protein
MAVDLRKLKDQASQLEQKEKHAKALEVVVELARHEPEIPRWPHKQGELLRRLGQVPAAIVAFCAAARLYAEGGFLVKALALCKQSLALNPKNVEAQALFGELCAQRPARPARRPATAAGTAAVQPKEPRPAEPALPLKRRTIPPGASLDAVELRSLLDARRQERAEAGAVFEIPIEEELESAFEGALADDATGPAAGAPPIALPRQTPLFSALDERALRALVEKVELRRFRPGERIIREGEEGESLFVIVEGEVIVYHEAPRLVLTRLFEGEFFGEIALLTHHPRSATVEAQDDVTLLELSRQVMGDLIEEHPEVLKVLLRFFRDRLVDSLTRTSELFAPFAHEERRELVARFSFLEVDDGTVLIRLGQEVDGLYILLAGRLGVARESGADSELGPGSVAGETALLTASPALATISARGKCWLLKLDRRTFREVIMTHPHVLACLTELVDRRRAQAEAVVIEAIPYDEHVIPLV